MEKLLNETNCFLYPELHTNNPCTSEDLVKMKAHNERLTTERQAGKCLIQTRSPNYEAIIKGALKINLAESELAVFRENFWRHKYNHYDEGPHFDRAHNVLDIPALLDEIFRVADSFDNPILGTYFAQSAYTDVQRRATGRYPSQSLLLKKAFQTRLAEQNNQPKDKPILILQHDYLNLFFNETGARRALEAAISAGIIDETGKKRLNYKEMVPAIIQFWEAVSDRKFDLTHERAAKEAVGETYQRQCEAIAEQFGATIGKSAIYDRAGQRSGKYFTTVARAVGGT